VAAGRSLQICRKLVFGESIPRKMPTASFKARMKVARKERIYGKG